MEPTGDATAPRASAGFAGRALSMEMGSVRLGGSGRPVTIASRTSDVNRSDVAERRQPRVVLEPQPRSPFGRKLETSVSGSLTTIQTQPKRIQSTSVAATPPERIHTVHHSTHRTPIAVALQHADASSRPIAAPRKRPATSTLETTTGLKMAASRVHEAKKNVQTVFAGIAKSIRIQEPPSPRYDRVRDLEPKQLKLFTRKPLSAQDDMNQSRSFHVHERLSRMEEVKSNATDELHGDPMSGWLAVEDSIDYMYEDPSIDTVQLQMLLHGNAKSSEKRKAVERERLQAASAELQKQRQGLNSKMVEFQHRREQILKMSEDIRTRNKVSIPKATKPLPTAKKRADEASVLPARKPPVPRLSQLGSKTKPPKSKKADSGPDKTPEIKPSKYAEEAEAQATVDEEDAGASDGDGRAQSQSQSHTSESILLIPDDLRITTSVTLMTAPRRVSKKRKANNSTTPQATQSRAAPKPQEEKLQRRAVAREYMQIQKQTRQLLRAKMAQQRQLEEERRRLDLQRLEKTRLLELEEARKRRIRQTQHNRAAQRKRYEQERRVHQQEPVDRSTHSPSAQEPGDEKHLRRDSSSDEKDTENQSYRGNHRSEHYPMKHAFEWPDNHAGSSQSSPSASSPRIPHELHDPREDPLIVPSCAGPKLQKLLALEAQTKRLAQKLQSLSKRSAAEESGEGPRDAVTYPMEPKDNDMENASVSESSSGDDSDSSGAGSEEENHNSDEDEDDDLSDGHSATRIDEEEIAFFDRGFTSPTDRDVEFDFSSIGVQNIQVVWPRDDACEAHEETVVSTHFEVLSSSSSSSSSSDQIKDTESAGKWKDGYVNVGSRSPKLLEESMDAYAERLLDRSARQQLSTSSEIPLRGTYSSKPDAEPSQCIHISSRHRKNATPPKRKRSTITSDAELLRLIRESDDNLSVIDSEAKRRFRLQQDRLRQQQQDQERRQQEALEKELDSAGHVRNALRGSNAELVDSESDRPRISRDMLTSSSGDLRECEKLDEILQAVITESEETERRDDGGQVELEEVEERPTPPTAAVEFWNTQLQQNRGHRVPRIEVDRRDIQAQHERVLELEEDEEEDTTRLLSPQTLAKRLLAAVEYHEAINEAHLQLSMMDKAQALEMVQQDTLALAQAFKEEMDDSLLTQQLEQEHAVLVSEFDSNLNQVVDQLETVREAEVRDHEIVQKRLEDEVRAARRRESAVQTEPPHQVDTGTSARLHVEASSATDKERLDAAVQHHGEMNVPSVTIPRDARANLTLVEGTSREQEYALSDDYEQESFDEASASSPLRTSHRSEHVISRRAAVEEVEDSLMEETTKGVGDDDQANRGRNGVHTDGEGDDEVASEDGDFVSEEEHANESIKIASITEVPNSLVEEDEDQVKPVKTSSRRHSQSDSVVYEDDEFEGAASPTRHVENSQSENVDAVSEDQDFEEDGHKTTVASGPGSASGSVSVGYEDDGFEHDASSSRENEPLRGTLGSFVEEQTSNASVSSEYGENEVHDGDDAKSTNDSVSVEYADNSFVAASHENTNILPPNSKPSPAPTVERPAPMLSPTIDVSRLTTTVSVPPEITRSYLVQLENRKRSEEALLDLRLLALESKLQQEMQNVLDEMAREEGKTDNKQGLGGLELRKDALQMGYLSEKANIESQKSAFVSRYYQDLLAFRSLGAVTTGFSIMAAAAVDTTRPISVPTISMRPGEAPVPLVTKQKDVEESESDGYGQDEFVASTTGSEMALKSNPQKDSVSEDAVHETPVVHVSSSEAIADEADDEIQSEQSDASEETRDDSISSAPEEPADDDHDYGDDEFVSASESAAMEKQELVDEDELSITRPPSIADELVSAVEVKADEASVVDDDEFAAVDEDDTVVQVKSDNSPPYDVDIVSDPGNLERSATVEGKGVESEPDEPSQGYEDDEFASVSENSVIADDDSVLEEASDEIELTVKESDHPKGEVAPDDDAMDDAYEDEFASISETAAVPDQLDSVSEDEIYVDTPIHNEIDNGTGDDGHSDDIYADDGFEESATQVKETDAESVGGSPSADPIQAKGEEEEQYSDEEFEPSELQSNDSTNRIDEPSSPELSAREHPAGLSEQLPAENTHPIDEYQAVHEHELSAIRSLSVANIPSQIDQEILVMQPALGESISVSLHEEDLTTASMEEQMQRIETLKRQIDLRKEAFAAVQKKLQVEKKKEHLREAETKLWGEMEQLESQLVADERILDLTRQRGRLESMELEAKHWSLQHGERGPTDLLADCDYCEPVEAVKPVITTQDHQAQVRLQDHQHAVATRVAVHPDTTSAHDLLLAFDHVEVAELPITTVATNTEAEVQPRGVLLQTIGVTSGALRAAREDAKPICESPRGLVAEPQLDLVHGDQPTISTIVDCSETHDAVATDLFSGYDHVELVDMVVWTDGLLDGYDHVEGVEATFGVVDTNVPGKAEGLQQLNTNVHVPDEATVRSEVDQGLIDQSDEMELLDESLDEFENNDEVEENPPVIFDTMDSGAGASIVRHVAASVLGSDQDGHHVQAEDESQGEVPAAYECEVEMGPNHPKDGHERIDGVTEMLLTSLLHDAIADIHCVSIRKSARMAVLNSHEIEDQASAPASVEPTVADKIVVAADADADSIPDAKDGEENEDSCHSPSFRDTNPSARTFDHGDARSDDADSTQEHGNQQQPSDLIVDRLFANLMVAAIQGSLRTAMKRRNIPVSAVTHDSQYENPLPSSSGSAATYPRAPPPQSQRSIMEMIVNQLRVETDRVTLPAFRECITVNHDAHNANAIYDAVLNVASGVHNQLQRDPLFLEERNADKNHQLLVEQVRREMEDSIWCVQARAQTELDRFARKMLEDEQGELDQDDMRLLRAQQRGRSSSALLSHFQAVALCDRPSVASPTGAVGTPHQRRCRGSALAAQGTTQGLAAQILAQEEELLAERIVERMLRGLVEKEIAATARR